MYAKKIIEYLGNKKGVDVRINGSRPHDIQVHNSSLYRRLLFNYSLGLGEGYMRGDWSCEDLEGMLRQCLQILVRSENVSLLSRIQHTALNMQSALRSRQVAERHYDIGNDLYEAMLDPYMQYSCAYWNNRATTLEDAQLAKMDLICRKLRLESGLKILDIGCGFGGLMKHMRDKYAVDVVGISLSKEQKSYGEARFGVDIALQDYRDLAQYSRSSFDRVVSVGMMEHVGYKNHRRFFALVRHVIKDDGIFLLQTIGGNVSVKRPDDWVDKYIFPNGMAPSIGQIGKAIEGLWVMEDWHNLGPSYARTLDAWHTRSERFFSTSDRYSSEFQKMWEFYLMGSKVIFDIRMSQLWQILFTPKGARGGLERIM
ncbi:MAG: cyclopropane fatty acyl phospholipid synthase [Gammaproteobacteria bacterium]